MLLMRLLLITLQSIFNIFSTTFECIILQGRNVSFVIFINFTVDLQKHKVYMVHLEQFSSLSCFERNEMVLFCWSSVNISEETWKFYFDKFSVKWCYFLLFIFIFLTAFSHCSFHFSHFTLTFYDEKFFKTLKKSWQQFDVAENEKLFQW